MPEPAATDADWVGTKYASERLGYSRTTIWRLIRDGDLTSIRAGKEFRLPRQLVEDARSAVMGGQSVVLREFTRRWSAEHSVALSQVTGNG